LFDVLVAMIAEVPQDHQLRYDFETKLESVMFTSPESMPGRWLETQVLILSAFKEHASPDTLPTWGKAVMAIWLNQL
jgi:hypothetical protein